MRVVPLPFQKQSGPCKLKDLEKMRFRKRKGPALYRNRPALERREGAAVRFVSCCARSRREQVYIENIQMRRYIVLRGSVFPQDYF